MQDSHQKKVRYIKGTLIGISLFIGLFYTILFCAYAINSPLGKDDASFLISFERGEKLEHFLSRLDERGVHINPLLFRIYLKATGHSRDLKAGEYKICGRDSIKTLTRNLVETRINLRRVTVSEGLNMFDVAELMTQKSIVSDPQAFLEAAADKPLLEKLNIHAPNAEGYLSPETYYFPKHTPAASVVEKMVHTFWEKLPQDLEYRCRKVGLTLYQAIILASLIQKETFMKSEMPLISAVYHNRLRKGMRLQADPTVIYAARLFPGKKLLKLSHHDLQIDSPYNTYKHRGLPPGPICNPSIDAIIAAVEPAPVDYLYFVSKGDGSHRFSHTLTEHNRAVWKYLKGSRLRAPHNHKRDKG
jgi:UPF0755 protein